LPVIYQNFPHIAKATLTFESCVDFTGAINRIEELDEEGKNGIG